MGLDVGGFIEVLKTKRIKIFLWSWLILAILFGIFVSTDGLVAIPIAILGAGFFASIIALCYRISESKKSKLSDKSLVPLGVKIIAILYYILAFLLILSSIILFSNYMINQVKLNALNTQIQIENLNLSNEENLQVADEPISSGAIFLFYGVLILLFSILSIFIARGLFRARPWAKNATIILSIINVIYALYLGIINPSVFQIDTRIQGLFTLVINAWIIYYLVSNTNVREAFAKK